MDNLKKELDDILYLDQESKDTILNVYSSWNTCKNNHQIIENLNNSKIVFESNYKINDNIHDYNDDITINKRTLYIDNCHNLDIKVKNKFNHIILINSSHINITIFEGLITGIDLLRSNNINLIVRFNKISNINLGYSNDCRLIFDKNTGPNMKINTSHCINTKISLIHDNTYKHYITNKSLFSTYNYIIIDNNMNLSYL